MGRVEVGSTGDGDGVINPGRDAGVVAGEAVESRKFNLGAREVVRRELMGIRGKGRLGPVVLEKRWGGVVRPMGISIRGKQPLIWKGKGEI